MKITFLILLSLFLLTLHVSDAWSQQPRRPGRTRRDPSCLVPEDLRLTRKQMEQMESIERHYLKDMSAVRNDLLNKRYRLRRLLSDPKSKADDIRSKQKEVFTLENQIQERILDYELKVRDILTPEQFRLWVSRRQMQSGHMMHHRPGTGMRHR